MQERAVLDSLVTALPAGGVVLLEGEPGIGKTALIDFVCARCADVGVAVVRVHADEGLVGHPFGMFAGSPRGSGPSHAPGSVDDLFDEFVAIADGRPLLLVVDDLQWADAASLGALPSLMRRTIAAGGAGVIAFRSGSRPIEVDSALGRMTSLNPRHISVGPMSAADIAEIGARHVRRPAAPTPSATTTGTTTATTTGLFQRAGGNPMYAVLLAGAVGEGSSSGNELDTSAVYSAVLRRARMLGATAFATVRVAAVLGRRLDARLISAVAGSSLAEVVDALRLGQDDGLLEDRGDGLEFRHDLVREALLENLSGPVRAGLHRRALEVLRSTGAPVEQLVPHLLGVELTGVDVEMLVEAALSATPATTLTLLDRAVALMPEDHDHFIEVAARRVHALMWAGRVSESLEAGAALIDASPPEHLALQLRILRVRSLYAMGRTGEALDSHRLLPDSADPILRSRELAELTITASMARRFDACLDFGHRALELSDDAFATIFVLCAFASHEVYAGDLAAAREYADRAVALSSRTELTGARIGPLLVRAAVRYAQGDCAGVLADSHLAHKIDDEMSRAFTPSVHGNAALALFDDARWDDAQSEVDAGLLALEELNVNFSNDALRGIGGLLAAYREGTVFPGLFEDGRDATTVFHDRRHFAAATLADLNDDHEEAFRLLTILLDRDDESLDRMSLVLAVPDFVRLGLQLGRADRCRRAIAALARFRSESDQPSMMANSWIDGLLDGDVDALVETASRHQQIRPFNAARILHHAAVIAASRGDRSRARELASSPLDTYAAIGADHLARQLQRAMQQHRVRTKISAPRPERFGWESVTPTEREIIDLVAQGLSNQVIADQLVMSRRTVESHLNHVYGKVGISSRIELVRTLLRPV